MKEKSSLTLIESDVIDCSQDGKDSKCDDNANDATGNLLEDDKSDDDDCKRIDVIRIIFHKMMLSIK